MFTRIFLPRTNFSNGRQRRTPQLHILFYSDTHSGFIRTLFRSAFFSKIGINFL
ncbi:hypothetical protein EV194_1259, partial [Natronoflexus pectinivorans]